VTAEQGKETEGTDVAPQTEAGGKAPPAEDLTKKVSDLNRNVTDFQEGRQIPAWLRKEGFDSADAVRAALEREGEPAKEPASRPDTREPDGRGEPPEDGLRRDPVSGRPLRPRPSEYKDDIGANDEDAYADAMDVWDAAVRRWEKNEDDLQNAELAEAQAADSIFKGDDAKPIVDAFDGDVGKAKDCALVLAAGISGGEGPASPEHVAEGFQMLQKALDNYLNAHAEEAMTRSREAAREEPTPITPTAGAQSPSKAGEERAPAAPGSDDRTAQLSAELAKHGVE